MKQYGINEALEAVPYVKSGNGVYVASIGGNIVKARTKTMYLSGLTANLPSDGQLIQQKTDREIGITNFDGGNKLNEGRSLLVTGLRMRFDTTTASVTEKTAVWIDPAPVAFKNGELVISQDGSGDLFETPISQIVKYNAGLTTDEEFIQVIPFLIRPTVRFFIQAKLAGNATTGQAYRLEFQTIEFTDADKA